MQKTYEDWIIIKKERNNQIASLKQYYEGQIYWCYLGENIGCEQDGAPPLYTRPAIIIKGFSKNLVWCVPISSRKEKHKYTMKIHIGKIDGILLLSQIRAIDTLRLGDYFGMIDKSTLNRIKGAIARLIQT